MFLRYYDGEQINKQHISLKDMPFKSEIDDIKENFMKSHLYDENSNEIAYLMYSSAMIKKSIDHGIDKLYIDSTKSIVTFESFHRIKINSILKGDDQRSKTLLLILNNS